MVAAVQTSTLAKQIPTGHEFIGVSAAACVQLSGIT